MASSGFHSDTTTLSQDSSDSYVAVAEVRDIGGPEISVDPVNLTSLDSTGAAKEFVAGLVDGGELSMGLVLTKAEYVILHALILSRASCNWKITWPDTSTHIVVGFMTKLGAAYPYEAECTCDCAVKVSGVPAFAPVV